MGLFSYPPRTDIGCVTTSQDPDQCKIGSKPSYGLQLSFYMFWEMTGIVSEFQIYQGRKKDKRGVNISVVISVRAKSVCVCVCVCMIIGDYHIAVSIKTLSPVE